MTTQTLPPRRLRPRDKILAVLQRSPLAWFSTSQIAARTGITVPAVSRILLSMHTEKLVDRKEPDPHKPGNFSIARIENCVEWRAALAASHAHRGEVRRG